MKAVTDTLGVARSNLAEKARRDRQAPASPDRPAASGWSTEPIAVILSAVAGFARLPWFWWNSAMESLMAAFARMMPQTTSLSSVAIAHALHVRSENIMNRGSA